MSKVIAINGSPRTKKGNTAMILSAFIEGIKDAGIETEVYYTSLLKIRPCTCGNMYCWYKKPGECVIKDDMRHIYPTLRESEIVIVATPVYIPLPGDMQNFVNRLCPLINPYLDFKNGRTRARFRDDVKIRKFVLVSTGGWWEKENMNIVLNIVEELAENSGIEFGGAVLRPHAFVMKQNRELTEDGKAILASVKEAGYQLIKEGAMNPETLESISRPLISEEELRNMYNQYVDDSA